MNLVLGNSSSLESCYSLEDMLHLCGYDSTEVSQIDNILLLNGCIIGVTCEDVLNIFKTDSKGDILSIISSDGSSISFHSDSSCDSLLQVYLKQNKIVDFKIDNNMINESIVKNQFVRTSCNCSDKALYSVEINYCHLTIIINIDETFLNISIRTSKEIFSSNYKLPIKFVANIN